MIDHMEPIREDEKLSAANVNRQRPWKKGRASIDILVGQSRHTTVCSFVGRKVRSRRGRRGAQRVKVRKQTDDLTAGDNDIDKRYDKMRF